VDPNLKLPYVINYNVGFTHAFGSNYSVEVEYVGNHGYRLLSFRDINQAQLGSATCSNPLTASQLADACGPNASVDGGLAMQESRPYYSKFPFLGFINQVSNSDYSNYNSLQVSVTKRMSHGLLFNLGYTYGHALDNGSLNRFGLNPENSNNIAQDYASSDFDVRHRLTATATYNIPGIKGFGQLLEGWQINTIVTLPPRNLGKHSMPLTTSVGRARTRTAGAFSAARPTFRRARIAFPTAVDSRTWVG
jgi:hypothetical protein